MIFWRRTASRTLGFSLFFSYFYVILSSFIFVLRKGICFVSSQIMQNHCINLVVISWLVRHVLVHVSTSMSDIRWLTPNTPKGIWWYDSSIDHHIEGWFWCQDVFFLDISITLGWPSIFQLFRKSRIDWGVLLIGSLAGALPVLLHCVAIRKCLINCWRLVWVWMTRWRQMRRI